jgi:meso-butanediol dehydrogenase / (S,S)-butanediol dehydrogenase / diacetyl reductase
LSKIIVITGAGAGLGRALARRFAADGETVVLLGRTLAKVEKVAAEIGTSATAVVCDVGSPDSVRAAFTAIGARHQKVDVLINNAGIYRPYTIAEATDAQILESIGTNLTGPVLCTRAALPLLPRGGHIINVSSESAAWNVFPMNTMYQATKMGLEKFSEAMVQELQPTGIKVTAVRAGAMYEEGMQLGLAPDLQRRWHEACIAVGLDFRKRPITHFKTVTDAFRAIIDLPPELHADFVSLHARAK